MKPLQQTKLCLLLATSLFLTGCSSWNNGGMSRWMKCALLGGAGAGLVGAAKSATAAGLGFAGGVLIGGTLCAFADNRDEEQKLDTSPQQEMSQSEEKIVSTQPVFYKAGSILFAFDSSDISPQAKDVLNSILQLLNDEPKSILNITGYTDNTGKTDYNWKLSQRRANAVKDYFISLGVNKTRIDAEGGGIIKSHDITREGRRDNRKADLTVHRPYTL
ncbi:putative lipoprotein YiaD [invertebrate metagenome]|uniref:Putative lipoprotein YiaD n=1 Tax=invertebrate metagenome TaxID=1711999 RepID=A0A2H9T575_9ZZZZ